MSPTGAFQMPFHLDFGGLKLSASTCSGIWEIIRVVMPIIGIILTQGPQGQSSAVNIF